MVQWTLGERVLLLRRRDGLTQTELADAVNLTKNTIARLERGEIKQLKSEPLAKLARHFGTSMDYLVGYTENDAPPAKTTPAQLDLVGA